MFTTAFRTAAAAFALLLSQAMCHAASPTPTTEEENTKAWTNPNFTRRVVDQKLLARISVEAKDLVSHMLVVKPELRFGSRECLAHPWLNQRTWGGTKATAAGQTSQSLHTSSRSSSGSSSSSRTGSESRVGTAERAQAPGTPFSADIDQQQAAEMAVQTAIAATRKAEQEAKLAEEQASREQWRQDGANTQKRDCSIASACGDREQSLLSFSNKIVTTEKIRKSK